MDAQFNIPVCPHCGSEHAERVAAPDGYMSRLEDLDHDRAGTYQCAKCEHHYLFEAILPAFDPTAQCPNCDSMRTSIVGKFRNGRGRYHCCLSCQTGFKTRSAVVKNP